MAASMDARATKSVNTRFVTSLLAALDVYAEVASANAAALRQEAAAGGNNAAAVVNAEAKANERATKRKFWFQFNFCLFYWSLSLDEAALNQADALAAAVQSLLNGSQTQRTLISMPRF